MSRRNQENTHPKNFTALFREQGVGVLRPGMLSWPAKNPAPSCTMLLPRPTGRIDQSQTSGVAGHVDPADIAISQQPHARSAASTAHVRRKHLPIRRFMLRVLPAKVARELGARSFPLP